MAAKLDEFAFVLLAGLIIMIVMLFVWGVPSPAQVPIVSPTSESLVIKKGSSEKFLLEINVTSKVVTLTSKGTIKDWVQFSDNNFESSGVTNVEVTVKVPRSAVERSYSGTIEVTSKEGGKVTIPLTVTVTNVTEVEPTELSRSIYIGDFSVTYAKGTEVVKTQRDVEVRKGMFEDKKVGIGGSIEKDMSLATGGNIVIDILYTNNEGNLIVRFNNQVVFDQRAMPGEVVIPIDKSLLKSYNVIEISTSGPGWNFWATSIYRIDKVEFKVDYFGEAGKVEIFNVYRDEIAKFKEGRVEFNIQSYEGVGGLIVKINDYTVYEGQRRGRVQLSFNYVDVGLVKGENTISFSTELGATYNIEGAKITLVHGE